MACVFLFIKKKSLAEVFSCEFCEIFKNTFFIEHLRGTASVKMCETHSSFNKETNILMKAIFQNSY